MSGYYQLLVAGAQATALRDSIIHRDGAVPFAPRAPIAYWRNRDMTTEPVPHSALDAVHDPAPSTEHGQPTPVDKPRRHWRVTKADYEAVIAQAGADAERMAGRLEYMTESRNAWREQVGTLLGALKRNSRLTQAACALALAGWAAFAVAVVWL